MQKGGRHLYTSSTGLSSQMLNLQAEEDETMEDYVMEAPISSQANVSRVLEYIYKRTRDGAPSDKIS